MTIAQTILQQLGGGRFITMTGARNLVDHGNALSFRLPSRFAKGGINYVKIELNGLDLYDITFGKVWGTDFKVLATEEGLYNDMLIPTFEQTTHLYTSL